MLDCWRFPMRLFFACVIISGFHSWSTSAQGRFGNLYSNKNLRHSLIRKIMNNIYSSSSDAKGEKGRNVHRMNNNNRKNTVEGFLIEQNKRSRAIHTSWRRQNAGKPQRSVWNEEPDLQEIGEAHRGYEEVRPENALVVYDYVPRRPIQIYRSRNDYEGILNNDLKNAFFTPTKPKHPSYVTAIQSAMSGMRDSNIKFQRYRAKSRVNDLISRPVFVHKYGVSFARRKDPRDIYQNELIEDSKNTYLSRRRDAAAKRNTDLVSETNQCCDNIFRGNKRRINIIRQAAQIQKMTSSDTARNNHGIQTPVVAPRTNLNRELMWKCDSQGRCSKNGGFKGGDNRADELRIRQSPIVFGHRRPVARRVWLTYPFYNAVRISTGCSGTLVSPRFVLTAAHCLHNGVKYKNNVVNHLSVYVPDKYRSRRYFVRQVYLPRAWLARRTADATFDYAILQLQRPVRGRRRFMSLSSDLLDIENALLNFIGYPSVFLRRMWQSECPSGSLQQENGEILLTRCDARRGDSGAAVYIWDARRNEPSIVGVISNIGTTWSRYVSVTEITSKKLSHICAILGSEGQKYGACPVSR